MLIVIVGIFHPTLNVCGGAEWVALNIIAALKKANHTVIILTNEKIDEDRIEKFYGKKIVFDNQIIFPFQLFPDNDLHNVYSDVIRSIFLKIKCDVVIDTYSNSILPCVDINYIHYPLFGRLEFFRESAKSRTMQKIKDVLFFLLYQCYERNVGKNNKKLFLANSKYTMRAITKYTGARPFLLYPPLSKDLFFESDNAQNRKDVVVSVARISTEKRLTEIPEIAKLTDKKIQFLIIGIKQSPDVLREILKLIKKNGVADRVKVITDMPRDELQNILRTSKVLLHPAHGEHFGVSIAESMASGCVPVVHNSGGPVEFIPDQYRYDTLHEAAEKIEKAIFEWTPEKSQQIIDSAQKFNEENFCKNFLAIFNSHLNISSKN